MESDRQERRDAAQCVGSRGPGPGNAHPFTAVGEARVDADRLCSTFTYPDGSWFDARQEIFKAGENKYEGRVNGVARTIFHRLSRRRDWRSAAKP
jgi:hypothetical protein